MRLQMVMPVNVAGGHSFALLFSDVAPATFVKLTDPDGRLMQQVAFATGQPWGAEAIVGEKFVTLEAEPARQGNVSRRR